MISILSHTQKTYGESSYHFLGKGRQHAQIVYSEWFKGSRLTAKHPAFNNARQVLLDLLQITDFAVPLRVKGCEGSKFLTETHDGLDVESVMIAMASGGTLCISSQVGCRMGCAFCETGKMGLLRSLSVEEIVAQVFIARFIFKFDFRNVVFMGMGEPLDNFMAVEQALRVLLDPAGLALGANRITVSTSGKVKEMLRFADEDFPRVNLAVSVNAPNDAVRNRLMPVNHTHNMDELYQAMQSYCDNTGRTVFAEYVLIQDKTDALEQADELAEYLKGLKVKVNLIPYNPQSIGAFKAPSEEVVKAFGKRLMEHGYQVLIRHSKGQREMAACGQLGNLNLRKKRHLFI